MAVGRAQTQPIDASQVAHVRERRFGERRLALERMQGDALDQVAQAHVLVLGQGLQHLEQALLQPDPGLDPLHRSARGCAWHRTSPSGIYVPMYQITKKQSSRVGQGAGAPAEGES